MNQKFPYPYPCEDIPRFNTQAEVVKFINQYKRDRQIKRCAHVGFRDTGAMGTFIDPRGGYAPDCHRDSFQIGGAPQGQGKLFYGCPAACPLYASAWWAKTKALIAAFVGNARNFVVGVAGWFASLSPRALRALGLIILLGVAAVAGIEWLTKFWEVAQSFFKR